MSTVSGRGGARETAGRVGHVKRKYYAYYVVDGRHELFLSLIDSFKSVEIDIIRFLSKELKLRQYEVATTVLPQVNAYLSVITTDAINLIEQRKNDWFRTVETQISSASKGDVWPKAIFRHYYLSEEENSIIEPFINAVETAEKEILTSLAKTHQIRQVDVAYMVVSEVNKLLAELVDNMTTSLHNEKPILQKKSIDIVGEHQ